MIFNSEGVRVPTKEDENLDDLLLITASGWAVDLAKELIKDKENIVSWEQVAPIAADIVHDIVHRMIGHVDSFQNHIKCQNEGKLWSV